MALGLHGLNVMRPRQRHYLNTPNASGFNGSETERLEADYLFAALMGMTVPRPAGPRVPTAPQRVSQKAIRTTKAPLADRWMMGESADVNVSVVLHGMFGGDLSATVTIKTTSGATVSTHGVAGTNPQFTATLPAEGRYRITVTPTAASPDDRYIRTTKSLRTRSSDTTLTISLNVHRENFKNVLDTWRANNVDPASAQRVSSVPLCGKLPQLNRAAHAKCAAANAAWNALNPTLRAEIEQSLPIVGGYNKRTTSAGGFSNHSIGAALDVNYNMETKQNYHFLRTDAEHTALLRLVQTVVRNDPTFASYDIFARRTGVDLTQWDAAATFNRLFPWYIEAAVARTNGATAPNLPTPSGAPSNLPQTAARLTTTREQVKAARDATRDQALKETLGTVDREWDSISAWLYGSRVGRGSSATTLVGMIPMHRKFVELMLTAGWSWGGNWRGSKDYMHFEDTAVLPQVTIGAAGATSESFGTEDERDVHDGDD